jgi:hypothetical protein
MQCGASVRGDGARAARASCGRGRGAAKGVAGTFGKWSYSQRLLVASGLALPGRTLILKDITSAKHASTAGLSAHVLCGTLWGNGKYSDDQAGSYEQGDRVGVLLDLNNGSLLFFKNWRTARSWLPSRQRDRTRGGRSGVGRQK